MNISILQITFLHVYHHVSTCLFSWGYLKYLPGEQGVIIGLLNSFVHVFMYSYYLIAALGPKYTKYLWWKKYMTWIQLVFLVLFTQWPQQTFVFISAPVWINAIISCATAGIRLSITKRTDLLLRRQRDHLPYSIHQILSYHVQMQASLSFSALIYTKH